MKVKIFILVILLFSVVGYSQSETLKEGDKAPDFTLTDSEGNSYTLSSYFEKSPVVVYFYPMAGTSGCTKQACSIRDNRTSFEKENIQVFGVSVDSEEKIKEFVEEYNLNFPLLSDEEKKVSEEYGVLGENGLSRRVTFIIDKEGKIAKIIEVKDISTHSEDVLKEAKKLG